MAIIIEEDNEKDAPVPNKEEEFKIWKSPFGIISAMIAFAAIGIFTDLLVYVVLKYGAGMEIDVTEGAIVGGVLGMVVAIHLIVSDYRKHKSAEPKFSEKRPR